MKAEQIEFEFQFLIGIINLLLCFDYLLAFVVSIPHRYYKSLLINNATANISVFQFLIGIINRFK